MNCSWPNFNTVSGPGLTDASTNQVGAEQALQQTIVVHCIQSSQSLGVERHLSNLGSVADVITIYI